MKKLIPVNQKKDKSENTFTSTLRVLVNEHYYLIFLLIGFGVFIEVSQYFTATRSAEFLDWLADSLGVLVYLLFAPNISIGLKK